MTYTLKISIFLYHYNPFKGIMYHFYLNISQMFIEYSTYV